MKLIRVSRWMAWAQARLIEIFRSISSPSKSVGQVPSSILPARVVAPAAYSSAADERGLSDRVVADDGDVANVWSGE